MEIILKDQLPFEGDLWQPKKAHLLVSQGRAARGAPQLAWWPAQSVLRKGSASHMENPKFVNPNRRQRPVLNPSCWAV